MICPYCQHELDVATLSCPRCGAAYPQRGAGPGMAIRAYAITGAMLLVFSVMLVDCVLNYLPGGANSTVRTGSPQLPYQPVPDLKSPAVDSLLNRWAQGQQDATQPLPGFIKKK